MQQVQHLHFFNNYDSIYLLSCDKHLFGHNKTHSENVYIFNAEKIVIMVTVTCRVEKFKSCLPFMNGLRCSVIIYTQPLQTQDNIVFYKLVLQIVSHVLLKCSIKNTAKCKSTDEQGYKSTVQKINTLQPAYYKNHIKRSSLKHSFKAPKYVRGYLVVYTAHLRQAVVGCCPTFTT